MNAKTNPSADEVLTINEVAALLRVGRATIEQAIADGRIPAVRLGARTAWRISRAAIDALLRGELRIAPTKEAA